MQAPAGSSEVAEVAVRKPSSHESWRLKPRAPLCAAAAADLMPPRSTLVRDMTTAYPPSTSAIEKHAHEFNIV